MRISRPTPTQSFTHVLNDMTLKCEIDYEASERQTYDDPGCSQSATLVSACTPHGDDIAALLSEEQQMEIEGAFLEQDYEP